MKGLVEFDSDNSLAVVDLKSLLNFQHDVELPHECICLWKKDGSKKQTKHRCTVLRIHGKRGIDRQKMRIRRCALHFPRKPNP